MGYLFTKYLDIVWITLIFNLNYFTEIQGQLGSEGQCRRGFPNGGQPSQRKILPVCTSSNSTTTSVLYFDIGTAPTQDKSECRCTITFENDQLNIAVLELSIGNELNGNITINGFSTTISTDSLVRVNSISTIQRVNELEFDISTTNRPMQACLRLQEATPNKSPFQAQCFQRNQNPSSENTGTGTGKSSDESGKGALIGGVVGGVLLIIIVAILVFIVCFVKRKQDHKKSNEKEEYYITENAMYNKPTGSLQRSESNQPSAKYETGETGDQNTGSDVKKEDNEEYYLTENAMYNQLSKPLQRSESNQPIAKYETVETGDHKTGSDEYYLTEDAIYNQPTDSLQRSSGNQTSINYEVIGVGNLKKDNDVYAEVDKAKKSKSVDKVMQFKQNQRVNITI